MPATIPHKSILFSKMEETRRVHDMINESRSLCIQIARQYYRHHTGQARQEAVKRLIRTIHRKLVDEGRINPNVYFNYIQTALPGKQYRTGKWRAIPIEECTLEWEKAFRHREHVSLGSLINVDEAIDREKASKRESRERPSTGRMQRKWKAFAESGLKYWEVTDAILKAELVEPPSLKRFKCPTEEEAKKEKEACFHKAKKLCSDCYAGKIHYHTHGVRPSTFLSDCEKRLRDRANDTLKEILVNTDLAKLEARVASHFEPGLHFDPEIYQKFYREFRDYREVIHVIPKPKPPKEFAMNIEKKTFINGRALDDMSDETLIGLITDVEHHVETLEKLSTESKHVQKKITNLRKDATTLAGFLDDRGR